MLINQWKYECKLGSWKYCSSTVKKIHVQIFKSLFFLDFLADLNFFFSAPGKVGNVNHQATPTSITLTWSPPSQPNGLIQHYVIWYQDIGTLEGDQSTTSNVLLFKPTTEDYIGVTVLNGKYRKEQIRGFMKRKFRQLW